MVKKQSPIKPKKNAEPKSPKPKSAKGEKRQKKETSSKSLEETLFELIQLEHSHFQEVLKISTEEGVKLGSPDSFKEIPGLQAKKKQIMADIHEVDSVLTPLKQKWLQKQDRTGDIDKQIQSEMAAMNRVLAGILQMDLRNHKLMEMYLLIVSNKTKGAGQDVPDKE